MKHLTKLIPLVLFLFSCSKPTSIGDLEAKDDIAVDPGTGQPFFGEAYLNFFDGQLRMQGMYEKGKKTGVWKYYIKGSKHRYYNLTFSDGNIISANYNENDRTWVGIPIKYSADSLRADGKYLIQERDQYDYTFPPKVFVQLLNSEAQGTLTKWHENGQIFSDGPYLNDRRNGAFTWWYDDGVIKETSTWHDGHQDGVTSQWYQNGNKFAEGRFVKGKLSGNFMRWYESGQKKEQTNFVEGFPDGLSYWWYEDGAKKGIADISDGLGVITLFSTDKQVSSRFDVRDNQIYCKSGELLFSVEEVTKLAALPIGDGACDCGDCSDESK